MRYRGERAPSTGSSKASSASRMRWWVSGCEVGPIVDQARFHRRGLWVCVHVSISGCEIEPAKSGSKLWSHSMGCILVSMLGVVADMCMCVGQRHR